MAIKRIIAHCMHEAEMGAAQEVIIDGETTESYVLGEIEENDIKGLQDKGVIVQVLEDKPEVEMPGGGSESLSGVLRRGIRSDVSFGAGAVSAPTPPPGDTFYLVRLKGPLLEQWKSQIKELNVRLLEYLPQYTYTAKLSLSQVSALSSLPFVSAVRLYGPEDTGPVSFKAVSVPSPPSSVVGLQMITYDVRLHTEEDLDAVLGRLKEMGVSVAGGKRRKIRLYLLKDSPLYKKIRAMQEVASIDVYVEPKLFNGKARELLGIIAHGGNPGALVEETGDGQIVGVADTGLDEGHPDFQGRMVGVVALGRANDASDPNGHGTHVAGSVLGDGAASGGELSGAAPGASLFFQSLLDSNGGLAGLPLNLWDLFEEAYQAGARIHNNSWGSATHSMYTLNSMEADEFVAERRDMLLVISAGNEGTAFNPSHSQPGFVDWLSIGSPASSKNSLTVGASRSSRTEGGYSSLTYGQAWPGDFPDAPIKDDNISGDSERLAAFSSRGPTVDHRIKPDVVAPGTDIASTKSSRAPLRHFWGTYPGNGNYAFMGGTSMAAPLISGCAALVREFYVKKRNHNPSAALVKATLINGSRWLTGQDAVADHDKTPNFHQGFGCIYMPGTIPNPSDPDLVLEFLDDLQGPGRFDWSGQRFRYRFSISGGQELRICLAWTDPPARGLQNNLNLFVQNLQSRRKWLGNEDLPLSLTTPDTDNNVEVVRLEDPQAGEYMIQISASNLLKGPQDFALVVTGGLTTKILSY